MNILVLGGTQFSGRSFVEQAVDAGHAVTTLHRSDTDPLPEPIRRLQGDRDPRKGEGLGEIKKLLDAGERFDCVMDMCGYTPRVVRDACELLADHADQYLFVSTISVYPDVEGATPDEDWPLDRLNQLKDPGVEVVDNETYGGLKVLCERVTGEFFGDRATIIRPGIIAGPNDPTDRVTWWTRALSELDTLAIPPRDESGLAQFIDARDLGAFFLNCAAEKITGVFNAAGPEPGLSFDDFVHRAGDALGNHATLVEKPVAWFNEHDIKPWTDIPTWIGAESQSKYRVDYGRAIRAGLTLRPLEETMRDTRAWDVARGEPELKAGMKPERMRAAMAKTD